MQEISHAPRCMGIHSRSALWVGTHYTYILKSLHWLPTKQRITFKVLTLMEVGLAPGYVLDQPGYLTQWRSTNMWRNHTTYTVNSLYSIYQRLCKSARWCTTIPLSFKIVSRMENVISLSRSRLNIQCKLIH